MARVYAIEDGDLSKSIAVSRKTKFSDIAIDFKNRESTNSTRTDINKVSDAQAVKQSVQNILTTGRGEKPFAPYFGSDLGYLLFSLDAEFDDDLLEEEIRETINLHEPRAVVEDVKIKIDGQNNQATCTITFKITNTDIVVQQDIDITRLR